MWTKDEGQDATRVNKIIGRRGLGRPGPGRLFGVWGFGGEGGKEKEKSMACHDSHGYGTLLVGYQRGPTNRSGRKSSTN